MTARARLLYFASFALLTAGALLMLAVAVLTLFQARRLYTEWLCPPLCRLLLRMWGVRVAVRREAPVPPGQMVYVSNHSSTLDIFVLMTLRLPRTRYFMSGFLKKVLPLGIIGALIRIFWTVPQDYPEQRVRIFQRADRILRRTGDSVYLSPEGMRVDTGAIGKFNKGAFHLATSLRAPIVPLYIYIPPEMDPGRGFDAGAGTVEVRVLPAFDTSGWTLEDLDRNRAMVRDFYVRLHAEAHGRALPDDQATGRAHAAMATADTA